MNNDVYIIIPAFNPNEQIMKNFLNELKQDFSNIVIVNDGSKEMHNSFFEHLSNSGFILLKHYVNFGKGRAIKTAINYILTNFVNCKCIITADCDGQHSVKDIKKCMQSSLNNQDKLVLGVRDFNQKDVPFKSKYGNKITRDIFKIFIGLNIQDTQTGLRAMGKEVATKLLLTKGERYEYETNVLIDCKVNDILIEQILIDTIYIDSNSGSHFNPIKDSLSIYKMFVKYIFAAISSFVLDIGLYVIILGFISGCHIPNSIFIATIGARIISSLYNYLINSKLVFKKFSKLSLIKYGLLVVFQMFVSAFLVEYLCNNVLKINSVIVKLIVDSVIFVVNFFVQRELIFKK